MVSMKRSDIQGTDEDLSAVEEFYLREVEQSVNADLIDKIDREGD